MPVEIKRVSYAWNSALEDSGEDCYFLDCLVCKDGETVVNRHESYQSREEFMSAMEEIVPLLEKDPAPEEYEVTKDPRAEFRYLAG